MGQNFRIFYLPSDRQANLPEQLLTEATEELKEAHIGRRVRKGATIFWGSILITSLHDYQGNVIGFSKSAREFNPNEIS